MSHEPHGKIVHYPCPKCEQLTFTLLVDWEYEDNSQSFWVPSFYYPVCWVPDNGQACDCLLTNEDIERIEDVVNELANFGDLPVGKYGAPRTVDFGVWSSTEKW
jgi:hypothetical protein